MGLCSIEKAAPVRRRLGRNVRESGRDVRGLVTVRQAGSLRCRGLTMKLAIVVGLGLAMSGCAGAEAIRTSQNTITIDASAAPVCGPQGSARIAAKSAAIETIKAGYDRFIIGGQAAQNNVSVTQMPGSYQTTGSYGRGGFQASSVYQPGPTIVSGSHDRQLSVMMFKAGDPGYAQALDAKEQLGPEWPELVKNGIRTCL